MVEYEKERGNYGEIKEREGVTVNMKRLASVGSPACEGRGGWCRKADVWRWHVEAWSDERRGGAEG